MFPRERDPRTRLSRREWRNWRHRSRTSTFPCPKSSAAVGVRRSSPRRLRRSLAAKDWKKHNFTITKTVDGVPKESTSHEIDHVRRSDNGVLALEIEWNNKDPFFDRDLENFKRLHAEGAISVGMLVTRGSTLQANMHEFVERFVEDRGITSIDELIAHGYRPTPIQRAAVLKQTTRAKDPLTFLKSWTNNFVKSKYGPASTHWDKLLHRVERGVGNPCPLVLIGLPASIVTFGKEAVEALPEAEDANLL